MNCRTFKGIALALSLMGSPTAYATLGGQETSVDQDHKTFKATRHQVINQNGFRVHQLTTDIGVLVNEYVNSQGVVFGVTWQGPNEPNLTTLFGSYFSHYQAMASQKAAPRGRAPVALKTSDIIVEHSGHMGAVSGRAWVASLLPTGVSPEDIK